MIAAQKQRAEFGVAGQVVGQEQGGNLPMDIQFLRGADGQADPVVVPGLAQTDRTGHGGDSHHLAGVVFQHEQVVGVGALGLAGEGLLRPTDAMRQALLVGRQGGQTGAGSARQSNQRRKIGSANGTNDHALTP
ncbi:hypothetical protein FQZ97_1038540 [compost metagenome]